MPEETLQQLDYRFARWCSANPEPEHKVCVDCGDPIRQGQRWKEKVNAPSSLRWAREYSHLLCFGRGQNA